MYGFIGFEVWDLEFGAEVWVLGIWGLRGARYFLIRFVQAPRFPLHFVRLVQLHTVDDITPALLVPYHQP